MKLSAATEAERARILASPRKFRTRGSNAMLAMSDAQGRLSIDAIDFDWFFSGSKPNDRTEDGIAIVSIEGPLEHHSTWCWRNYEDIVADVESAMTGEDIVQQHARSNYWSEDYEPIDPSPARAVVLDIDSPGGEAAGATWCHRKLRALSRKYNVPLYAYAREMAASAAYEIASSAQEIWTCDTGLVGSIGVIATLFDRTAQNTKLGLQIELITSGAFKADSHADRKIDDGIRGRIQARVDELAMIFWRVVAKARDTSPKAIADLQANVFVGRDAVDVGIADGIASWDKFLRIVGRSLDSQQQMTTAGAQALTA